MSKLNWKKVIGWGVAALVVIGVVGTNMYNQQQNSTGKKNVYVLLPLSGPLAQYGKDLQQEIKFLVQDKKYTFNTVFLDSAGEGQKAMLAFQQATLNEENPIVITTFSTVGSAIAPAVAERNGFMFALSTFVVKSETDSYLKLMGDEATVMKPVVEYIKKEKLDKIGVFYIETDYGLKEYNYLVNNLKGTDSSIVKTVSTSKGARDVRIEALELINSGADTILILGETVPAYMNLIRELKAQEYKGKLIADGGLRVPMVLKLLEKNAENIVFPALMAEVSMPHSPEIEKNIKILEKYNLPTYYILLEAADTLELIQYTLDKNLPFSRQTYENIKNWSGMMGNIVFKGEKVEGHNYILSQFKDGKIVPVTE